MFLFPLSYSCWAEILSRFKDISLRSTAPASTASITATGAPLQTYSDPIPPVELAADVVKPEPRTAASKSSWVGAAATPYSARAIDHRLDAAYLSTGKDSATRSERDRSSNNIEGDI